MKNLIVHLLALFFSISLLSQSKEDYKNTLDFISTAYNEKNASVIHQKFSSDLKQKLNQEVFKKRMDSLHSENGKMSSYELILEDEKESSFLVEFEDSSMLLLLYLSPDSQILKFDIKEY